jgi:hypothetical protein
LHADAQRYTVICEEPNWVVRCMEEPRLEMLARQHGIQRFVVRDLWSDGPLEIHHADLCSAFDLFFYFEPSSRPV